MTGFKDCTGKEIRIGDFIEHTGHGEWYQVRNPGTGGYFANHDGPILITQNIKHRDAFKLTEIRAAKARVVK